VQSADHPGQTGATEPGPDQHRPPGEDQVYGITTADSSHTEDISRRQKQYILTMLIRVVSIVVVVFVPGISWPVKIGLCFVATIIPYVAVVRANGGPTPQKDPTNLMIGPPQRAALGSEQPGLPGGAPQEFLRGEYVRADYVADEHAGAESAHGEYPRGERLAADASDIGHNDAPKVSQSSTNDGVRSDAGPAAAATVDQSSDQVVERR
jgi:hypothetical protein